jgi:hypothetical protein
MDKKEFRKYLFMMTSQKDWVEDPSFVEVVNRFVLTHETDPLRAITDFSALTKADVEDLFQQGVTKKALLFAARQKKQHQEVRYFLEKHGYLSPKTR